MIVIRSSRARLFACLLGSFLFVALGGFFLVSPPGRIFLLRGIGAVSLVFFGACGGAILRRLLRPTPAVVIDRAGIIDNAGAAPAGFIAWDDITRIAVLEVSGQSFVSLDVRDREALYSRSKARALLRANADMTGYPVNLPAITLDRSPRELCDLIERYWRKPDARASLGLYSAPRS